MYSMSIKTHIERRRDTVQTLAFTHALHLVLCIIIVIYACSGSIQITIAEHGCGTLLVQSFIINKFYFYFVCPEFNTTHCSAHKCRAELNIYLGVWYTVAIQEQRLNDCCFSGFGVVKRKNRGSKCTRYSLSVSQWSLIDASQTRLQF